MAQNSKIEWTDHTVNLWWGCSKVHTGCKNCYAEALSNRFGDDVWGKGKPKRRIKSAFSDLDKYERKASKAGVRSRVFVGSMMDIFEESNELINPTIYEDTTHQLREELFTRITAGRYDNLIFLFLTKRPENISANIPIIWGTHKRQNVWFGTSISDINTIKFAVELQNLHFLNLFLSIEPQIGEVYGLSLEHIKWVIQGGESGHNKRPFDISWGHSMKRTCERLQVPFFFKQIDKVQPIPHDLQIRQLPKYFTS